MKHSGKNAFILSIAAVLATLCNTVRAVDQEPTVRYGFEDIDGLKIFFREAGDPSNPAIVTAARFSRFLAYVSRGPEGTVRQLLPDRSGLSGFR
jgi:hypothetical protein